ncbi:MAG TPA: arsenite methyltransferase [Candidatus Brocadiia bacterium]|nr:arsenite methyltransferase [Candidatus Brocadiia bacterium]
MDGRERSCNGERVHETVREAYGKIASGGGSCCGAKGCCGSPAPTELAGRLGYGADELAGLPDGANLGLSCGNPAALAALREGEVVLDLGSGAGFDVFIAARRVGARGRVIGVDMTAEMLAKARRNAAAFRRQTGLDNVEFRLGEIEHLPVADSSVDVVLSNCVINLSPDKPQVWREIARALKRGGRVAVSDLALLKPLPEAVKASVEALVGCVAGAVLAGETAAMARQAGLVDVRLESKPEAIEAMSHWNDPQYAAIAEGLPAGAKLCDYVTSLYISARKP